MGQQQFLLLVVTVVIVGLAVAVGISMFSDGAASSNRDAVSNDLVNLATRAQEYVRRPAVLGGGGGSFMGYDIPGARSNADGQFSVATKSVASVDIQGIGIETGYDGSTPVKVVIKVTADSVRVVEIN